jgi:hypothetical protein
MNYCLLCEQPIEPEVLSFSYQVLLNGRPAIPAFRLCAYCTVNKTIRDVINGVQADLERPRAGGEE